MEISIKSVNIRTISITIKTLIKILGVKINSVHENQTISLKCEPQCFQVYIYIILFTLQVSISNVFTYPYCYIICMSFVEVKWCMYVWNSTFNVTNVSKGHDVIITRMGANRPGVSYNSTFKIVKYFIPAKKIITNWYIGIFRWLHYITRTSLRNIHLT